MLCRPAARGQSVYEYDEETECTSPISSTTCTQKLCGTNYDNVPFLTTFLAIVRLTRRQQHYLLCMSICQVDARRRKIAELSKRRPTALEARVEKFEETYPEVSRGSQSDSAPTSPLHRSTHRNRYFNGGRVSPAG